MIKNKALRQLRLDKGWTQGRAAKEIGIQQSYLSKLENDQAIPSIDILKKISDVYNCQVTDIAQVNQEQLEIKTTQTKSPYWGLSLMLLGIFLIALAFFGVLKNNTAYTYELLSMEKRTAMAPNFIVTDEFMGEKYVSEDNFKATYVLLGERDISPSLNRTFYFVGVILSLIGLALLTVGLANTRRIN
jgi:transcriptional regulator with XRE-family HTH domain